MQVQGWSRNTLASVSPPLLYDVEARPPASPSIKRSVKLSAFEAFALGVVFLASLVMLRFLHSLFCCSSPTLSNGGSGPVERNSKVVDPSPSPTFRNEKAAVIKKDANIDGSSKNANIVDSSTSPTFRNEKAAVFEKDANIDGSLKNANIVDSSPSSTFRNEKAAVIEKNANIDGSSKNSNTFHSSSSPSTFNDDKSAAIKKNADVVDSGNDKNGAKGNVADAGNNNPGIIEETIASHFTVQGGNVVSPHGGQVDNSAKIEYNVYLLPEAQGPGDLRDKEKWKELTDRIEKLVTKSSGGDDDTSEEEPSDESELPVDTRRFVLYTGTDIAKKKLKTTVEIVFTLTPAGLAPGVQPWVTVVWRVLRFQPSIPIRHELTWHDETGFCDVLEENDNTLKPGNLSAVVKPKHIAVLRDNDDNPDFSTQFKMTLETADMAIVNEFPSAQRLALCSIDRSRPETDRFSPVIDIGSVKPNDIVLCGPPVMLQAYAIRGYTERLPIDVTKISRALFVDSAGKQKPVDIRTLRPNTAFRLYSNSSGKIILEKD